ncbi:hypothetical protein BSNK01_27150 [Bacillaceae bacterium]
MEKRNRLDELAIAQLTDDQLAVLREAERRMNEQRNGDEAEIYIIALQRPE